MDAIISAIRRFIGRDGEGLLSAATQELDKVATRLHAASARIGGEISRAYVAIEAERVKLREREAKWNATRTALGEAYTRAIRVAKRIEGLVE